MSRIDNHEISILIDHYEKFCKSVEYRSGEDFYVKDNPIIELSYNENPLGPGKNARMALKYYSDFAHLYPPIDYNILINKLAGDLNLLNNNILISAGSVAAIHLAVFQYTNTGDNVIYSKSSMPWYKWSVLGSNAIPIEVPLLPDMNHDLDGIIKAINNKTKVIILSNPHNPTGLYYSEELLYNFYKQIPENILLIVDQAYYEYQTNKETILINLINDSPNLMLTRTFSKIHGLAGLRVGYGISNSNTIKSLKAKWLGSMPTISSLSVFAALHALDDKDHINKSVLFNNKIKNSIGQLADKYGLQYLNSEANFITINVKDSQKNEMLFVNEGIRFTPGYFYGYNEWARLSFNKQKFILIKKLNKILNKIK